MIDAELIAHHPPTPPRAQLIWTALVDVDDRQDLGHSPLGHRFLVPILGGSFQGGDGFETLCGEVLPGGADRQLLRPDGVKELDAVYEMRLQDGTVLSIRNQVTVDESRQPERYAMSVLSVRAPTGRHDWLNRRLIVGTLQSTRPARQAVIVRAWQL